MSRVYSAAGVLARHKGAGFNPTPLISSLDPAEATQGEYELDVVVTGAGFLTGTTATFDGASRSVTYSSATEVTVHLLADDLDAVGLFNIVLSNPPPGGGSSVPAQFNVVASGETDTFFDDVIARLHFDGTDGATTFTDVKGKVWTAQGNAQLDTSEKKFGESSLLLDGTGDYVSTPNHADWAVSSGDVTIRAWIRFGSLKENNIINKRNTGGDQRGWTLQVQSTGALAFAAWGGSATPVINLLSSSTMSLNTWYHVAVSREGTTWRMFINGAGVASGTQTGSPTDNTENVNIGRDVNSSSRDFNGRIDELDFTRACRYTTDFTPPTGPEPDA